MSVIRIRKERERPYVIVDKTALEDERLSFRAKGLHTYLMSRPDDWCIHLEYLAKQSPTEGREAIAHAMHELMNCGYASRKPLRNLKGQMQGWETIVYETPLLAELAAEDERLVGEAIGIETDEPTAVFPNSAKPNSAKPNSAKPKPVQPNSAKPQLLIKDSTNEGKELSIETTFPSLRSDDETTPGTDQAKPKKVKPSLPAYEQFPGFLQLWGLAVVRPTGSKGNKHEALEYWKKLPQPHPEDDPVTLNHIIDAYAFQKTTAKWQENGGEFVKEIQRWIKHRLWEGVTVPSDFDRHQVRTRDSPGLVSETTRRNLDVMDAWLQRGSK